MNRERIVELARGPAEETAKQACDRYEEFLDVALAGGGPEASARRLRFYATVTPEEVRAAEERLGLTLPPSYVEFVTQWGLFSGPGEEAILLKLDTIGVLYDHFMQEVFVGLDGPDALANELGTDAEGVDRLRKLVYFAEGQYEGLLDLFRLDAANEHTGEAPTDSFDREDYAAYGPMTSTHEGRGFDQHVVGLVDFNIREVMKDLGIPVPPK